MIRQELENLSIEQLLELKEMMDAEIRRKKLVEHDEALKELKEAWKKFRKVCPYDTYWVVTECDDCGQPVDVDLYDVIDEYGFK